MQTRVSMSCFSGGAEWKGLLQINPMPPGDHDHVAHGTFASQASLLPRYMLPCKTHWCPWWRSRCCSFHIYPCAAPPTPAQWARSPRQSGRWHPPGMPPSTSYIPFGSLCPSLQTEMPLHRSLLGNQRSWGPRQKSFCVIDQRASAWWPSSVWEQATELVRFILWGSKANLVFFQQRTLWESKTYNSCLNKPGNVLMPENLLNPLTENLNFLSIIHKINKY